MRFEAPAISQKFQSHFNFQNLIAASCNLTATNLYQSTPIIITPATIVAT